MTTGELVEAMALFAILTLPMRVLGFLLESLPRAVVSVDRLDDVIATEAAPIPDPSVRAGLPAGPLGVTVADVGFAYPDGPPVLDDLRFAVRPGEVVALDRRHRVGQEHALLPARPPHGPDGGSGRGRRRRPDRGRPRRAAGVRGAGVPGDVPLRRHRAGEPHAVRAGGRRHRRLGRRAWPAPTSSSASSTDGRDTVIGERGVTLSGGQRQRLALARALLRHPRLLILDDATSAVDPRIEQQILAGLRRELDMTTIVVAHRVSTIALADRVLYLDEGRLVADGTHAELLATVPGYEALIRAYDEASRPRTVPA